MGMKAEKECRGCGLVKPLGEFYRRTASASVRSRCKACYAATKTARRRADPAKANAYRADYNERRRAMGLPVEQQRDAAAVRAKSKRYRERHPERVAAQARARYYADVDAARSRMRARRIGRAGDAGAYSEVLRRDPCCYCGEEAGHVDHIHPKARGGTNDWDNLTAACRSCNSSKCAEPLLPFLLRRDTSSPREVTT